MLLCTWTRLRQVTLREPANLQVTAAMHRKALTTRHGSPVRCVQVRQAVGEALDFALKPDGSLMCPLGFPFSLVYPSAGDAGSLHPVLHCPFPFPALPIPF